MREFARRDVVKAAVLGTMGMGACATAALAGEAAGCTFADTVPWNAQYDVVVVGFGGAGATSAITAADAGARVLLVDKAPLHHEGGNTRYSGQFIKHFAEDETGLQYVREQNASMGHMDEEICRLIWSGSNQNIQWLKDMGIADTFHESPGVEYPDFPSAHNAGLSSLIIDGRRTKALWEGLREAVANRPEAIDVWFASPAKRLVQDPQTKTVVGAQIEHGGELLNVRALNGVVLACGGFENNDFMMENYQNRPDVRPFGTEYNTGDGILMAGDVGAQLWHMACLSGPFMAPLVGNRCFYESMYQNFYNEEPCILVGPDGNRFCNDAGWSRHGHRPVGGEWLPQLTPEVMWAVFDETARASGNHLCKYLSDDLSAEIESGQVVKAESIEELEGLIGIDPNRYIPESGEYGWIGYNETYRPAGLVGTVERYNRYCAEGFDPEYFVKPEYLAPLETPPFYAIRMYATCVNTQGGAKRNVNCEVLDCFDEPIPHLYSAGEFGSFYGGVYDGGGNLSEGMFTGRIAGAGAAAPKEGLPVVEGAVAAVSHIVEYGSDALEDPQAEPESENEFIGRAHGLGGIMQVGVTVEDGAIVAVRVASHGETVGIGTLAIDSVPDAIVAANSVEVDSVAGATVTSDAIKRAVASALADAGIDVAELKAKAYTDPTNADKNEG